MHIEKVVSLAETVRKLVGSSSTTLAQRQAIKSLVEVEKISRKCGC